MTTYRNTPYETAEELRDAINTELADITYPITIKHRMIGEGQLTLIKAPLEGSSLYATVDFSTGTKTLALDTVLANRLFSIPEDALEIILEAQTAFKEDFETRLHAKREAEWLAQEQAEAARKKALEEKKAEERYQNQKAKAIRDFETQAQSEKTVSATDEFYYSLGWLAKHVGAMTAILPDYLGSAFEKYFGAETPKTLVDSRAKTSGGYAKQWSWEFKCTIKKLKETVVPAYLQDITTDFSKGIHNTSFLWDLVENYGFQFGPKQDIEKIRSHVPSEYIAIFEEGLA